MSNNEIQVQLDRKLTPRQRQFVVEYQKDLNGTQAAIRAGYSRDSASQQGSTLLANQKVKAALAAAMERRLAAAEVNGDYLVHKAREVTERCTQDVRPVLGRKGEQAITQDKDGGMAAAFTFDAANALRGIELLAKLTEQAGMADNTQVNVNINMDSDEVTRIYSEVMAG